MHPLQTYHIQHQTQMDNSHSQTKDPSHFMKMQSPTKNTQDIEQMQTPSKIKETLEHNQHETEGQRIMAFLGCVCVIYLCQIVNGVLEERIYKVPYQSTQNEDKHDFYTDPLSPMVFSSFFAAGIGYLRLQDEELQSQIPMTKLIKLSLIQILIHFSLMWALMNASYILVVMANSCGLLSVIVVGVYFSQPHNSYNPTDQISDSHPQQNRGQVQRHGKSSLGSQKIIVCLIVCAGIFCFNYFTPRHEAGSSAQSASILTFLVLGFAILLQGIRPQFQSQIKRQYNPSHTCFYYMYNRALCLVVLILSIVSLQFTYTVNFILHHDHLFLHITVMSLLNAVSALFIFKIITLFRQHIYPLVSTVRKCITVGVSILYFGHHVGLMQFLGMLLVFGGVLLQISMNYKLLQKWQINLPFANQDQMERYVKNKQSNNHNQGTMSKKYQVYKILDKEADIEGI